MPLGFEIPYPGGMNENSPPFQRWVRRFRDSQVPKGRQKLRGLSAVPSGLTPWGAASPALNRWAIVCFPFGKGQRALAKILVALDCPVCCIADCPVGNRSDFSKPSTSDDIPQPGNLRHNSLGGPALQTRWQ